ncbi:nucleotide exchange factor GrpE [Candidatus Obscuribacterales bacterium]|nr:nucleotide exchange factor GrpE [Candidatus Obscuribacterales bacterium]MBX3137488.1 nucleotide exchange factor GrpE [Candidatus Obscuribacterales bacterium]MBX3154191.1 nucleotide exchange factor GrpE [Candidatus Obscuribacterales bacterium]
MGDESENKESLDAGESSRKGGKQDRSSSAKAFYRAMYAGAEPDPEDYGMSTKDEPEQRGNSGPCPNCTRIQQDMEGLEKRTLEAENHYKRMAADFENYRKRVAREKEEFSANGIQRAIEAILPALDDMDMAKTKLSADMDSKAMMESLNMVYNRFNRCLEQIGIKQLAVIGEMFDPVYHEPVQQVPSKAVPDGAVVHQLRPGYMFGDKVLRPSLVNVATSDGAEDIEEAPAQVDEAAATDEVQEDEGEPGSRTQDLPIVDVTADLEAKVFEDKDEEGNE